MQAYSLTLARAGYTVIAFDFEGHGRNAVAMSGDVTAIDGTTRLLVKQTQRVIAAARQRQTSDSAIALLGHSMATDVIIRAALEEIEAGYEIATIVGISTFSEAITQDQPASLLTIIGQWESRLRAPALKQLQMIDPHAMEGDTARGESTIRRVVTVPNVEHVSILFSEVALQETLDWMNMTFKRTEQHANQTPSAVVRLGGWILLLLAGTVLIFKPLVNSLPHLTSPATATHVTTVPARRFWLAVILPAGVAPLLAFLPPLEFLPVLVAEYLMYHLALFGAIQLLIIRLPLPKLTINALGGAFLLALWGIAVFGLALDRYAASFLPTAGRLTIIGVLCGGTIIFMIADSQISGAGRGRLWQRVIARAAFMASIAAAAAIDPERLVFLLLILPVLLLFYLVHGLMGRWIAQRCGSLAAGVGLGVCLAWALGVSFPLFDAG